MAKGGLCRSRLASRRLVSGMQMCKLQQDLTGPGVVHQQPCMREHI